MKKRKPSGVQVWWCIASGKVLLPFTARTTRRVAIRAHCFDNSMPELRPHESAVKILVMRSPEPTK